MSNIIPFPDVAGSERKHVRNVLASLINCNQIQTDEIYIKLAALVELLDRAEYKLNKMRHEVDEQI